MWGEPREGTEAHKVKQLAEKKKQEAKEKGLDDFFSKVFHDVLSYIEPWSKNGNNEYVHPKISNIKKVKPNSCFQLL